MHPWTCNPAEQSQFLCVLFCASQCFWFGDNADGARSDVCAREAPVPYSVPIASNTNLCINKNALVTL